MSRKQNPKRKIKKKNFLILFSYKKYGVYININPRIIFNIVNQNQYPLGVLSWRYLAPICESTSVAIVLQMRCVGLILMPMNEDEREDVSRLVMSGGIKRSYISRLVLWERKKYDTAKRRVKRIPENNNAV
jgi:hypothetical protein